MKNPRRRCVEWFVTLTVVAAVNGRNQSAVELFRLSADGVVDFTGRRRRRRRRRSENQQQQQQQQKKKNNNNKK